MGRSRLPPHPERGPAGQLLAAARELSDAVDALVFSPPVDTVYNPLAYARLPHEAYIERYARETKRTVFVGMNPGPWGMAQTGVPFGDVETVRDWLGLEVTLSAPARAHPARPILGLACPRVEVSGRRLWGLVRRRFGPPAAFFREHFVANYCPLLFLESDGRNRTPDKLPRSDRERLFEACDRHLARILGALAPRWAVGVGSFATARIRAVVEAPPLAGITVVSIPHPSPASPRANAGWAEQAAEALERAGVWPPRERPRGT